MDVLALSSYIRVCDNKHFSSFRCRWDFSRFLCTQSWSLLWVAFHSTSDFFLRQLFRIGMVRLSFLGVRFFFHFISATSSALIFTFPPGRFYIFLASAASLPSEKSHSMIYMQLNASQNAVLNKIMICKVFICPWNRRFKKLNNRSNIN